MFLYLRLSLLYQSRFRSSLRPWHCMPVWAWPCDVFIRTDMTKTALVGVRLDTATQRLSLSNLGMFLQCQQTALNLKTNSLSSILSQNPSYEFYKIFPHSSPTKRDCQSQTNKSSACIPFLSFCKQLYGEGPSASSESLFLEYPNSCQATPKLNHNVTKSSLKIYIYDIRCTGIQYMLYIYICVYIFTSYICIRILLHVLYGDWNVWALWSKRLIHIFLLLCNWRAGPREWEQWGLPLAWYQRQQPDQSNTQ